MSAIRIEPMRPADLDAVVEIERASFPSPWSRRAFLYELEQNRVAHLWVGRADGAIRSKPRPVVGYLCVWVIAGEIHVTNLAVHPAWRRQGVARHLLGALLEHYRRDGATRVVLEVRPGNVEARRLYEAFGFREVGLRKGYYFDTGEDALLLEVDLTRAPVPGGAWEPPSPLERSG